LQQGILLRSSFRKLQDSTDLQEPHNLLTELPSLYLAAVGTSWSLLGSRQEIQGAFSSFKSVYSISIIAG